MNEWIRDYVVLNFSPPLSPSPRQRQNQQEFDVSKQSNPIWKKLGGDGRKKYLLRWISFPDFFCKILDANKISEREQQIGQ